MTQHEIGKIYNVNQCSISVKLKKIVSRLKYASEMKIPSFTVVSLVKEVLGKRNTLIIMSFLRTTSQTETARQMNRIIRLNRDKLNQVKVKYIIHKSLERLEIYSKYDDYKKLSIVVNEIKRTNKHLGTLHCPIIRNFNKTKPKR